MGTGGTDDSTRPPHGEDPVSDNDQVTREPSAPWERPARWAMAQNLSDASSLEELLKQITATGPAAGSRRRRRERPDAEETAVSASELIAALATGQAAEATADPPDAGEVIDPLDETDQPVDLQGDESLPQAPEQGPATAEVAGMAPGEDPADAPDGRPSAEDAAAVDPNSWEAVRESLHRDVVGAPVFALPALADLDAPATSAGAAPVPDDVESTSDGAEASGAMAQPPPRDGSSTAGHADTPHRGWWIAGRAAVAFVAVVTLLMVGTYWVITKRADAVIADNQVTALVPDDSNIVTATGPVVTTGAPSAAAPVPASTGAENILMLGSDTRAGADDAKLGGGNSATMQSDVLMLLHISADRSHVSVVSIPRDLYVEAPSCKAWDYSTNTLSDVDYDNPYSEWKITNAYSVGGPQCTVRAVQQLTGLRIDRVIIIDFAGFKTMVDELDGITVNVCRPIVDGHFGTILPTAGEQHINGTQALELVRARKVQGDGDSDLARIRRQQKVLSTMLREVTSAGVLLDPRKLDGVLQAFVHNVQTANVTFNDLVDIAQSLGSLDPKHVTFYTLPTVPADGTSGLNMAPVGPLVWKALRNDQPLPGEDVAPPSTSSTTPTTPEAPATPEPVTQLVTQVVTSTPPSKPQVVTVAPGDVDLQVVNVTGRGGVATQAMNLLTPSGFDLAQSDLLLVPGDVRSAITVEFDPSNRAAALTVAAAVPGATLVPTDGLGSKVRLLLGSEFDGTIDRVAVGESLPSSLTTTEEPVVSTVVSTVVTTPSPSVPSTSSSTPSTSGPTLGTDDVQLHNAANTSCI